jgi:hypothetical protein
VLFTHRQLIDCDYRSPFAKHPERREAPRSAAEGQRGAPPALSRWERGRRYGQGEGRASLDHRRWISGEELV